MNLTKYFTNWEIAYGLFFMALLLMGMILPFWR